MDSTAIRQQLRNNVPPDMREAYDKLVTAGMKFMFDKKTHRYMLEQMQAEGEPAEKLGQGIADLIGILASQAKGAFPQHLIIPVGIELLMHAAEFAQESGAMQMEPNTMADAIQIMVFAMFKSAGVNEDQVMGMIDEAQKLQGAEGQQTAPQQSAPPQGPAQQSPQGLINAGA